jgi:glycosyltransferase involved in cell wall biosynthesis
MGKLAIQAYQREFGLARAYVNLPYFSDLSRFADARPVSSDKCGSGNKVILFSGSLTTRKGVDLLARAFARVLDTGVSATLRFLGTGPLLNDLRDTLVRFGNSAEFLGFKDWQELPSEYARADVLCVPSRHDGWGLVVPEGLAAGLPVISTRTTGAAVDFIKTGFNGWLLEENSARALEQALLEAIGLSPTQLEALSRNARLSVSEHSLAHGVSRFVRAVHGALEDKIPRMQTTAVPASL